MCFHVCTCVHAFVCTHVSDPRNSYQRLEHAISPLLLTSVWSVCMHKVHMYMIATAYPQYYISTVLHIHSTTYPQYCMLVNYHHDVGVYRALCECIGLFGICVYILCIFKVKVYNCCVYRYKHTLSYSASVLHVCGCLCLFVCLSVCFFVVLLCGVCLCRR